MQENNFEKQVQQKMDELQFLPSEPVWQKVEAQIRRKKERRRAIFLLLPLLLLGGGMIFYFSNENKVKTIDKNIIVQQAPAPSTPIAIESDKSVSDTNTNVAEAERVEDNDVTSDDIQATTKPNNNTATKQQKGIQTFTKKQSQAIIVEDVKQNKPLIGKRKSNVSLEEMHALVLENEITKKENDGLEEKAFAQKNVSKMFQDSVNKKGIVASPITENANSVATINLNADTTTKLNTAIVSIDKKDSAENTVAPATPAIAAKQKKGRNWEWTVAGRYGVSGTRTQMLDVFSVESAADFYASPASGSNTQSPAFSSSNTITNSSAFSLGAGVRKKMFQNTFVSIGVQYSQYGSQSYVGTRKAIDTTVNYNGRSNALESYYTQTGSQSRYTTRFHYIELPLAFEYRLFKKVPLQLQHGISAGYLFKTNALYFDRSARIYYENDEWLRKVGFNVFTSLDYRLLRVKNFMLYAGPQLQWGITPIQQKTDDKKHHQFFAGLQTRIAF